MIDFKKFNAERIQNKQLKPREIFMSLPKKDPKYEYAWDVQSDVWQQWFEKRDEKDIIIKMNTGSGKTVVGLTILKSCLNEDKKPAIYVVPSKYLAEQVIEEAKRLGIEVTDDDNDIEFIKGNKILIINIYKLVNGMSIFGLRNDRENIKIGSILIDDVHACLLDVESQHTIEIKNSSSTYSDIFKMFEEELMRQAPYKVCDMEDQVQDVNILVPYWIWQRKNVNVYKMLSKLNDDNTKYKLPLLKDVFPLCNCVVSGEKIEITPKGININDISGFYRCKTQNIYECYNC